MPAGAIQEAADHADAPLGDPFAAASCPASQCLAVQPLHGLTCCEVEDGGHHPRTRPTSDGSK